MRNALNSMSFVLPVRKGGLGNQMFQIAAAMVYAKETNRRILLPKEFYNLHNPSHVEYGETIFREIIHRIERPIDENAIRLLTQQEFQLHPGEPGFEDWSPVDISGNVLLHGYFQSYPPIGRHEQSIRSFYLSGLGNFRAAMKDSVERVGIHIRRGDYLKPPYNEVLPTQPISYYEKALQLFPKNTHEFYIFSDDLDWCKQQELFQSLPHKVFVEEPNEIRALALMTTCQGGMICANSTFSWWGAFLGAYALRNHVTVPRHWFRDGVGSLFPSEWILIE